MKVLVKLIIVSIFLLCGTINAQEFIGEATYKSKRQIDVKLDSTQMYSGMQEQVMEMLKKQFEKTHILTFNKEESVYIEEESLGAPNPQGMQMTIIGAGGSDVLYKNLKEKRNTNMRETFSKLFLVKGGLKEHEWTLESDTKNIGEYTCFKATMTREVEEVKSGFTIDKDEDSHEKVDKEAPMKTITITAWYTPQIPVSAGPAGYHGLPGLILETNDGSQTIICSKIIINPKKSNEIIEPTKGKEVTQEEFDAILIKKMKDMQERFRPNGRGDGERIEIRIGG
ncbi:GLPGLI family protein [Psychroserpens burtonensis]|uniref:GLPGLI family protein n=1 Tax=Psychroserpens burtonensis TaxID=49278 RepID=A0A5C7B6X4_9FLAO|nr:GLPGLI family protein [Psychroserpens burtonensis]TXE17652.1 GLPGLI family protein [Psychroserpens burtonensis]